MPFEGPGSAEAPGIAGEAASTEAISKLAGTPTDEATATTATLPAAEGMSRLSGTLARKAGIIGDEVELSHTKSEASVEGSESTADFSAESGERPTVDGKPTEDSEVDDEGTHRVMAITTARSLPEVDGTPRRKPPSTADRGSGADGSPGRVGTGDSEAGDSDDYHVRESRDPTRRDRTPLWGFLVFCLVIEVIGVAMIIVGAFGSVAPAVYTGVALLCVARIAELRDRGLGIHK